MGKEGGFEHVELIEKVCEVIVNKMMYFATIDLMFKRNYVRIKDEW